MSNKSTSSEKNIELYHPAIEEIMGTPPSNIIIIGSGSIFIILLMLFISSFFLLIQTKYMLQRHYMEINLWQFWLHQFQEK